ncbi:hypothetical protein [Leptospira santarosai]|uniref:hypothetical protein n=1 Tax=Leptospira santarosai TaxID=28183 RepID=UPI00030D2693|nr:hypothetical protein LEP1GSC048_1679 [Leptospira santarosai serovar Shermani str. 1342KT]
MGILFFKFLSSFSFISKTVNEEIEGSDSMFFKIRSRFVSELKHRIFWKDDPIPPGRKY